MIPAVSLPAIWAISLEFCKEILHLEAEQHKHKPFGPDFLRTFLTLTTGRPGVKSFSPSAGPQRNAVFGPRFFRNGRQGFSKNFAQKKAALIFWPLFGVSRCTSISALQCFLKYIHHPFYHDTMLLHKPQGPGHWRTLLLPIFSVKRRLS